MKRPDPVGRPLLTAEWKSLAMLNYEVDGAILAPFLPAGTELDAWNGRTFVSMVGFLFLETRIRGIRVPFHRRFEEVNLRFYVRRRAQEGWRRAVVFVQELVPRAAIAWSARALYNENYRAVPMGHEIVAGSGGETTSYWWRFRGRRGEIRVVTQGPPSGPREGSQEEFITEHYGGYARQRDGSTLEYRVEHPPWRVWSATRAELTCDAVGLYGGGFAGPLSAAPASAFLAEGSAVAVYPGVRLGNGSRVEQRAAQVGRIPS